MPVAGMTAFTEPLSALTTVAVGQTPLAVGEGVAVRLAVKLGVLVLLGVLEAVAVALWEMLPVLVAVADTLGDTEELAPTDTEAVGVLEEVGVAVALDVGVGATYIQSTVRLVATAVEDHMPTWMK